MNEEQQELCRGLIIQLRGYRSIEKEEFAERFPSALEGGKLALRWLQDAYEQRNGEDLQCAMLVGFTFGFRPDHIDVLRSALEFDWHMCHEDIVSLLDCWGDPKDIDALFHVAQWVPKYLEFDDARALAVKAIWALGNLACANADAKLDLLSRSDNDVVRRSALEQLKRRGKDGASEGAAR